MWVQVPPSVLATYVESVAVYQLPLVQFWYTGERDMGVALPFPEGHPWLPCKSVTEASLAEDQDARSTAALAGVNPS